MPCTLQITPRQVSASYVRKPGTRVENVFGLDGFVLILDGGAFVQSHFIPGSLRIGFGSRRKDGRKSRPAIE